MLFLLVGLAALAVVVDGVWPYEIKSCGLSGNGLRPSAGLGVLIARLIGIWPRLLGLRSVPDGRDHGWE